MAHGISSALGEGYTARPASRRGTCSRLTIESHGRACEVGRFLTDDERCRLAARLERLVGKTSESPALAPYDGAATRVWQATRGDPPPVNVRESCCP